MKHHLSTSPTLVKHYNSTSPTLVKHYNSPSPNLVNQEVRRDVVTVKLLATPHHIFGGSILDHAGVSDFKQQPLPLLGSRPARPP